MKFQGCLKHHREAAPAWKPCAVRAQETRSSQKFYFNTDIGVTWQQDLTVKEKVFGFTTREKVQFDPGARLDFAVGYHFTDSFAAEFETGLMYNPVSSSGETSINSGNVYFLQVPLFANVLYTVPTREITKAIELGLTYKYTGTLEHSFDRFSTTLSGNQIHSLLFLFRIRF